MARTVLGWLVALPLLFAGGTARAQTATFVDRETGVSFRYPTAWTRDDADAYGADPLIEKGNDPHAPGLVRFRRGWSWDSPGKDSNYGNTVSFAYAVLPERTAKACAERFAGWASGPDDHRAPATEMLNGTKFTVVTYEDAGLGHSWSFDLYTLFHAGRCLAFSVGSNTTTYNDLRPLAKVKANVPKDADEVMRTVRVR